MTQPPSYPPRRQPPQPPPRPPQPDRSSRRWSLLDKFLATLTALFALATAVLGLWTAQVTQDKKDAQADAASSGAKASALQQQNNELQTKLIGPTGSPLPNASPTVRHAGQVTLAVGGPSADLDAPDTDEQWGANGNQGYADVGYDGSRITFTDSSQILNVGTTAANYDTCKSRTGYVIGSSFSIGVGSIKPGVSLCEKTNQHRYSVIRLLQLDASKAIFDVVTYDPQISG